MNIFPYEVLGLLVNPNGIVLNVSKEAYTEVLGMHIDQAELRLKELGFSPLATLSSMREKSEQNQIRSYSKRID